MSCFIISVIVVYIIAAIILNSFLQKRKDEEIQTEILVKHKTSIEESKEQDEYTIPDSDAVSLAEGAETELEAQYVLSKNSSEAVQIAMAEARNFKAQCVLIQFPDLCGEALVKLCEYSGRFNFDSPTVDRWFTEAIIRTELTSKQEIRISRCKEFVMKRALLHRENLTGAGLVELCENSGCLNLDSKTVEIWYQNRINNIDLTEDEQLRIAKTRKFTMHKLLLLSPNLKANTLVEISENSGSLNLDSQNVWRWFEEAAERLELTSQQQVKMIASGNFAAQRAIILKTNIDYKAFLLLCQNTQNFNMKSKVVHNYFENATRRLLPTISDDEKVKLAQTKIEGVIKGLM